MSKGEKEKEEKRRDLQLADHIILFNRVSAARRRFTFWLPLGQLQGRGPTPCRALLDCDDVLLFWPSSQCVRGNRAYACCPHISPFLLLFGQHHRFLLRLHCYRTRTTTHMLLYCQLACWIGNRDRELDMRNRNNTQTVSPTHPIPRSQYIPSLPSSTCQAPSLPPPLHQKKELVCLHSDHCGHGPR